MGDNCSAGCRPVERRDIHESGTLDTLSAMALVFGVRWFCVFLTLSLGACQKEEEVDPAVEAEYQEVQE
jgi:hypothetical protein